MNLLFVAIYLCFSASFCAKSLSKKEKIDQPILIKEWLKKPLGSQIFIIKSKNKTTSGKFYWDLQNNIWKFEYSTSVWIIKDNEIIRVKNGKTKKYKCNGIFSLLTYKIADWHKILLEKNEICIQDVRLFSAKYQKNSITWEYKINPFVLLKISFFDTSGKFYEMHFTGEKND